MIIRILIVEDEEATAQRLAIMLQELDQNIHIAGITESVDETINWLKANQAPDLMMLDIHLADGSAFDLFSRFNIEFPVIFATAYDEYAIRAFKVNSIDYLLKPLKRTELQAALEKFNRLGKSGMQIDYSKLASLLQPDQSRFLQRMMVKTGQQIKSFPVEEIAYFYIAEKIVFAKLRNGDRYPLDQSLDQLEYQLDSKRFFRINRAFIISFESIDKLYTYSKSRIKVLLKPACEVESISSTDKSPLFRDWLNGQSV